MDAGGRVGCSAEADTDGHSRFPSTPHRTHFPARDARDKPVELLFYKYFFRSYFPIIYQCLRVAIDLYSYIVTIGQTCWARVGGSVVHQVRPATCSRILADRPPIGVSVYGEERLSPGRWVRLRKFGFLVRRRISST